MRLFRQEMPLRGAIANPFWVAPVGSATCVICLFSLLAISPAQAATWPAASCAASAVQAAINSAADGDTVTMPAGTCSWTTTVTMGALDMGSCVPVLKAITLQGAGIDQTIIADNVDPNNSTLGSACFNSNMLVMNTKPGGLTRVTGLTFQGGTLSDPYNKAMLSVRGNGTSWRVDHIHFVATQRAAMDVGSSSGVVDHNVFDLVGWHFGIYSFNGGLFGDQGWSDPNPAGTAAPYFIEDNIFRGTTINTAAHDGWSGCKVVFRHNTLQNAVFSNHGTESGGRLRSARFFEVYENSFSFTNDDFYTYHDMSLRGGNGYFFNNSGTGPSSTSPPYEIAINYGRTSCSYDPWGEADGLNVWDSNDPTLYASGTHTGSAGAVDLTDAAQNWTTNQWIGYVLRNTTKGFSSEIIANTAKTITINNSCLGYGGLQQRPFDPGDAYEIRRVTAAFDQTGRGQGDLLSGDTPINTVTGTAAWPHQASEPAYAWNNTYNGQPMKLKSWVGQIVENRDFFNTPKSGYIPYTYPHPLVSGSTPPPPPPVTPWSGILDPSRAANWQRANVGVQGGIPTHYTQCGPTIAHYDGPADVINNAIGACGSNQFVLLGPGTFNLTTSITSRGRSSYVLRGSGSNSTKLIFSGAGAGGIFSAPIFISNNSAMGPDNPNVQPGGPNACDWTAGYAQGTMSITLSNCGSVGILNGDVIALDQQNDTTDTHGYMVCDYIPGGFPCNATTSNLHNTGRVINGVAHGQTQRVKVVSGCATACNGAGPYAITIQQPLYANNWGSNGRPTGAYFLKPIHHVGVENLTVDATFCPNDATCQYGISFLDADQCWVKNVRVLDTRRGHVGAANASRMEIRDSYMWGVKNAASQSYGVELNGDDSLIENNVFQQVSSPFMPGGGTGNVWAYNFSINNPVGGGYTYMQASYMSHTDGDYLSLFEGNDVNGLFMDQLHGTSGLQTAFRNWLPGRDYNIYTPGDMLTTNQTFPIDLDSFNRGINLIGNVLGTPGYHTTGNGGVYEAYAPNVTARNSCNHSIYELGYAGGVCDGDSTGGVPDDPLVHSTLMRWGNYDVISGAVRWDRTEATPAAVTYINANPEPPANHLLPVSFYLTAKPSWWGSMNWPATGPDVTGGMGPGGFASMNPAHNCYRSVLSGPADGSGPALAFDAAACYGAGTPPPNNPPTITMAAKAAPATVTSTFTVVSVLGADDGGEPALIYTWNTLLNVTYSGAINGSNAAKSITANFAKAGTYNFQVTIRDAGGLSVTSSVNVSVNQSRPPASPKGLRRR